MTEITMPRLSDAMEEGTVLTWLKQTGEHVDLGEELVEIETDKATMTYESPEAGILEIVAAAGASVAVGTPIARVGAAVTGSEQPAVPVADQSNGSAPPGPARSPDRAIGAGAIRATPLARRLAHAQNVDLQTVTGTGPHGRIRRSDVALATGVQDVSPSPAREAPSRSPPSPEPGAESLSPDPAAEPMLDTAAGPSPGVASSIGHTAVKGGVQIVQPTRLQQVVARRMAEAKATVPEFQVEAEVAVDAAMALRAQLKELDGPTAPSLNDMIVKACALALRAHPRANASYRDGVFELYSRVNIGVAVAAVDALVVPTVTDADTRSLGSIASETRRLVGRVRNGAITPPELSGATFTVSNLGMYGMSAITPVINPPQAAILGVGAARAVATVIDGGTQQRRVMTLRLTCDHRILYGADAAELLRKIRGLLEEPLRLVL